MAVTPNPLVWDYYRELGEAGKVGGVAHYYTEEAQSLFLQNGLSTRLTVVPDGHWNSSVLEPTQVVSEEQYQALRLDHAYNGTLFGVAVDENGKLVFLRYVYALDLSNLTASGTLSYSNSNGVAQMKVNVMNTDEATFLDDATLFQPGSKITFDVIVGKEEPYPMGIIYLDSSDYSVGAKTVPISGRNSVGFKLMDATFDDVTSVSGTAHEVAVQILEMAGITKYIVGSSAHNWTHLFKPTQTLMSGLEQVFEFYNGWELVELPDGTIVIGYPDFIKNQIANSYYAFDKGEVFKRKTKRSSDAAYRQVRVTGRGEDDSEGNPTELTPVTVAVKNYSQWSLPAHKTYHIQAPDGFTQEELQEYAETVAESLQYVGIGEDFTGPLRPQLLVGDVAAIDNGDGTMTTLGIITSLKHRFGQSGFYTDFTTDSGGVVTDNSSGVVTITKNLQGYNRSQTLKDLIKVISS